MKLVWQHLSRILFILVVLLPAGLANDPSSPLRGTDPWAYQDGLHTVIEESIQDEPGYYAVAIKHLVSGEELLYNSDVQMPSASLYKLAVLYTVYKEREAGQLSFDESLTMTAADALSVDDEELNVPIGGAVSIRDAVFQMITISDNSSAILLLRRVGADKVNRMMRDLGLTQTSIGESELAMTSPSDILMLLEEIYRGDSLTLSSRQEMLNVLLQQAVNDRLPRYLPPWTPVAHKTGELWDIRNDAGIVYAPKGAYLIVVMAEGLPDADQGVEVIARMSRNVYDYFAGGGS